MYYFGIRYVSIPFGVTQQARHAVLDKLVEWNKDDPRPWGDRLSKPYFNEQLR